MNLRLVMLAILLCLCPAVWAQDVAELSGLIKDASGASLPGAEIRLVRRDTGTSRSTTSNERGLYALPGLQSATYDVEVRKTGFQTQTQTGVTLNAGDRSRLDFTLKVSSGNESVTVTETSSVISETTGTLQNVIEREQINALPLNGRNAAALVALSPGTADLSAGNAGGRGVAFQIGTYPGAQAISSNGSRADGVNYFLDGGSNLDPYTNVNNPFPNPDALQEFSVQTNNFSAEGGRATGAVVNAVTRSGTDAFHGSAFEYLRNGVMNARNYFSPVADNLKRNQFGGGLGGPILKSRLFFFGSYQGTELSSVSGSNSAFVLTENERNGDFSALLQGSNPTILNNPETGKPFPNNQIPKEMINSVSKNLLAYIPVGTGQNGIVYFSKPDREHEQQWLGRVDYYPNDRNRLYVRYFRPHYKHDPVTGTTNLLAATNGADFANQNISVGHTFLATATLVNSLIFSYNQNNATILSAAPVSASDLGVNIAHSNPPGLQVTAEGDFSFNTREPGQFNRQNYQISDVLHWSHKRHEVAIGGDYLRMSVDINNSYRQNGAFYFYPTFTGNSLSDLLIGDLTAFLQGGGEYAARRGNLVGLFAQDNIRVNNRLNVNIGLRWDPYVPYGDKLGRTLCFRPGEQSTRFVNAPVSAIYAGDKGCPAGGSASQWAQFGPRVGMSYALDRATVLRGGAGFFYQPPFVESFNNMVDSAPFSPQYLIYSVPFANPFQGMTNPFPAQYAPQIPSSDVAFSDPMLAISFEQNWKPTQVVSWNLTLERQLAEGLHARAAYVGSKGTHLSYNNDLNVPIYGPGATSSNIQQRRPYQNFQSITMDISGANSNYNALQLSLHSSWSDRLTAEASYTWSRSLDWNSFASDLDGVTVINPANPSAYRGPSDFNVPHRFVFNGVWNLPSPKDRWVKSIFGRWQMSGIWNWQSGYPLTIGSGVDNSATGIGNDLADVVSKPTYTTGSKAAKIQKWFSTDSFRPNTPGTFGNSSRNMLIGPGTFNIDYSLQKTLTLPDGFGLNLRGEAFNVLNHAGLNNPTTTLSSSGFGQITSARDPRIMQISMKLTY